MKREILRVRLLAWVGIGLCLVGGHALRRPGSAAGARAAAADQPDRRSDPEAVRLAIDRSGQHGRPRRRHRRRRKRSQHHLHRIRHRRHLEDARTTARRGRRSSTRIRCRRSAISRSRRRIPTSSMSARARRTTARARRSAPASTSRSTAARAFQDIGLKDTQSIGRIVVHPKDPNIVVRRRGRAPVRPEPGARPLQDDRRRQDLDEHEVHRREHRLHRCRDGSGQSERPDRRVVPAPAHAVGIQRRRPGQRPVEDDATAARRWTKLTGNGLPDQSDHRANRPRHRTLEAVDDLRVDRSRTERRHRRRRQRRRHAGAAGAARRRRRIRRRPRPGASAAGSDQERRLAIGRRRQDVALPVEPGRSLDVLQPDADRSHQPGDRVSGRRAVLQDDRRRQDVEHGAGDSAQRPSRDLDRSARTAITW